MPHSTTIPWGWHSRWAAPAKLNLFLHVTGRRADGYHLLQTLFCFLDYGDALTFSPRDDGKIEQSAPLPGVPAEQDLTLRAARLLQAETGCQKGVTLHLGKKLPMGGGLGGGSSNAATTLLALNYLWGLELPRSRLQELGLKLGADVPVFIFGKNAFAEGVGAKLTAVTLPPTWYLVLSPPVHTSTATVFQSPKLCRDTPPISIADWHPGFGHNDLEPVACQLSPSITEYLEWLRQHVGIEKGRMSGSGSCVFAECKNRAHALSLFKKRPAGWQGWITKSLQEHPLLCLPDRV